MKILEMKIPTAQAMANEFDIQIGLEYDKQTCYVSILPFNIYYGRVDFKIYDNTRKVDFGRFIEAADIMCHIIRVNTADNNYLKITVEK